MRGVILAGGTGSRLDPLTRVTNKHLLPVYDRPMIHFAIAQLVTADVTDIVIVTSADHAGAFDRLLGDGRALGARRLEIARQVKPGGIAEALGLAAPFAAGGPVAVLLGDNIFERSVAPIVERFRADPHGGVIVLAPVDDPTQYGIAVMDGDRIARIVEKSATPAGNLAVTGLYLYDEKVFDIVRTLRPSDRGELEITDVNNRYLDAGELRHERISGYWIDCGESIPMLFRAAQLVAAHGANVPAT
ncbi:MAG: sugar phosphate nucleotidyltransferase [Chloroflexota bacterium]|nr:sugar phosphate nucleotidyltransferase [Chloroflexota bacterium]